MKLGTILPSKKSLEVNDDWWENQRKLNEAMAKTQLSHCIRREEQGEIRYYLRDGVYALMRHQKALWFARRKDGYYYPIKESEIN